MHCVISERGLSSPQLSVLWLGDSCLLGGGQGRESTTPECCESSLLLACDLHLPFFMLGHLDECMGGTLQASAGFQDSDFFHKGIKLVSRCILSVIFHPSGFKL